MGRMIPASAQPRVRWSNDQGWRREIVRMPDRDEWDWRLSVAESDGPAPFSVLPGIDRELMLLRGTGLVLRFADGDVIELRQPFEHYRFAGDRPLIGEPIEGPTEQLNLLWRRDRVSLSPLHNVTLGPGVVRSRVDITGAQPNHGPVDHRLSAEFIHVLQGELSYQDGASTYHLRPGDSLQLDGSSPHGPTSQGSVTPVRFLSIVASGKNSH